MEECAMEMGGELFKEVLAITPAEYIEPEMHEGTFEVVGLMSDFEKKVYTAFQRVENKLKAFGEKDLSDGAKKKRIMELTDKKLSLKDMLYFFITDRLGIWGTALSVSQDWKVVIPEEKVRIVGVVSNETLQEILMGIKAERGMKEADDPFADMSKTVH